jgi:hypothetical protein
VRLILKKAVKTKTAGDQTVLTNEGSKHMMFLRICSNTVAEAQYSEQDSN